MTAHTNKNEKPHNGSRPDNPLATLANGEDFLWPYRSFAKAILATQKDAFAYIDANRRLMDEMRDILRKEQDLALEISQKSLDRVAKNGWSNGGAVLDASEVSAMFEAATSGWQELGEAWMQAQMRSFETLRSYAEGAKPAVAGRTSAAAAN